ncbi:MAG: tRNA-specific adenosine deaminase [Flavobacteriales bacterium]|nr:tRNA-specific adenosine deaminase [Flavobacteriales bacterium]|tara:strand:+ start:2590 stop:3045 length:456 start_codon:yes stop_codon:yes gene_type:complete
MINTHETYMLEAIKEAKKALSNDEVPIGAVIVHKKKIIARAHNMSLTLCDPTAHAEMQAITSACNYLKSRYLNECTIYITLEPCRMCFGALFWAQIGHIVYGAEDIKYHKKKIIKELIHKKTILSKGILKEECGYLLSFFFEKKRKFNLKK